MVDPVTPNRGYAIPLRGADVGTWDVPVNGDFTLIDNNLGGVISIALTNVNVTLVANQYQYGTIRFVGALSGNVTITFPSAQAWRTVANLTTGNFYVRINAGGAQSIALPPGIYTDVCVDNGNNFQFRSLPMVGEIVDLAATAVPLWISSCSVPPFLNCDGSSFSAGTYPALAALLGGNTLPDSRGRFRATLNQGQGRITSAVSGVDGDTLFASGGSQDQPILTANLPNVSLSGTVTDTGHTHPVGAAFQTSIQNGTGTNQGGVLVSSGSTPGGLTAANNVTGITVSTQLGSGTELPIIPPTYMGGITLIRAA